MTKAHTTPPAGSPADRPGPREGAEGSPRVQRAGFWLGIVLFAGLLALPTPESMRAAARECFADSLAADTASLLATSRGKTGTTDSPAADGREPDVRPPDEAEAEARVVERYARTMLSAAAVTALVACWWITVALPIPITSLLPLVLFPLVGVLPVGRAAAPYADANVFLFMGGFIIALAIEKWGLHRRMALGIVARIGGGRRTIVLGFMVAAAVVSMWISNTATTLMMLPIAMAVITAMEELTPDADPRVRANFAVALLLGVAYAASIGGVATPVGTPPNIAFFGIYRRLFPDAPEIGFAQWMLVFAPLALVFVPVVWWVLVGLTCRVPVDRHPVGREVIREQRRLLPPMNRPQRIVAAVFAATAGLWITRSIPYGGQNHGWSAMLERLFATADGLPGLFRAAYVDDATVALAMAALLFMIPAGGGGGAAEASGPTGGRYLMDWETAQHLPWGVLLLFGGGFCVAAAFRDSGLSHWCGSVFAGVEVKNPLLLVLGTCLMLTFLTELTSNTATTQVMLPILARVSHAMGVNPLMLMIPATVSASCAFMLPVATPPNAIVFGTGRVPIGRMVRTGLIINLVGVVLVTLVFYLIGGPVLGAGGAGVPEWAR